MSTGMQKGPSKGSASAARIIFAVAASLFFGWLLVGYPLGSQSRPNKTHASAAAASHQGSTKTAGPGAGLCQDTCSKAREVVEQLVSWILDRRIHLYIPVAPWSDVWKLGDLDFIPVCAGLHPVLGCDDGSFLLTQEKNRDRIPVFCDPGTDCEDCGPWTGPAPSSAWSQTKGPIAFLMDQGVEVFLKRSATEPQIFLAFTDHNKDVDVSHSMMHGAVVEPAITRIFIEILKERCQGNPEKPPLMLDVGANFGWFSFFSAALGCRVLAWEPVPLFQAFLEYGLQMNNLGDRVTVRAAPISSQPGQKVNIIVPNRGIWGTAGIDGLNIDNAIANDGPKLNISVVSESLDTVVSEPVALLKIDVEGYEPYALEGASRLLKEKAIDNVILEYSPGVRERGSQWTEHVKFPRMLQQLLKAGFQIGHIHDALVRDARTLAGPLTPFPQVTLENLKYDVADSVSLKKGDMGCKPKELRKTQDFPDCGGIPETLHPYSFHSVFGHNTNIWATRTPALQPKGKPVGVLPLDTPLTTWTVPKGQAFGMGGRTCAHMPPEAKIYHRCPCDQPKECGALEELVNKLAAEGKMPYKEIAEAQEK